ncbi:hypothetical protein APA_1060 [Pseudanabaena sp. lw0831]|nr:hypothetical protein APA_1060 [Pseudanabaena sp. lw0831]
MNDEDIDTSDIPPLSAGFWAKAQLSSPKQITTSVQIDSETFAWFQSQGENAAQQMSAALKIYAEAHKSYLTTTKS